MIRYILVFCLITFASKAYCASLMVLDGGEGLLVRVLNENNSIWIDTGGLNKIRENLNKFKKNNEPYPSDIFLTHLHPDHASGIFEIIEKNPGVNIYDNCMPNINLKDGEIIRWTNDLLSSYKKRVCVNDKSKILFGDIEIEVLWPTGNFNSKNHNFYSLVLKISRDSKNILIMGDATSEVERWLIKNKAASIKDINVLIVGHHGSDAASSEDFINAVSPDIAVVSANKNNIRGYPSEKIIKRLNRSVNNVWITGKDGDFNYNF